MALKKIKLGELLEPINDKNSDLIYSLDNLKGISIKKEFIETKANMEGVSLKPYLIVKPDEFAYVTVTSRNGEKITIAHNDSDNVYIVSSSYNAFRVKRKDLLNSKYLFMYFNRFEFDRYSRFNSWGSAREVFTWQEMCDIEIELPDLPTQKKFVNTYLAMIENQKAYEQGLEDLKLVCDAYIEDLRKRTSVEEIGPYLALTRNKNIDSSTSNVLGISKEGFISPKQGVGNLSNYYIFEQNDFVYNHSRINIGSIGLYKGTKKAVCSPIYVTFRIKDLNELYPEYLMLWLQRSEFLRSTDFYSIASVRNNFTFESMGEVKIPIPDINIQKSIANVYSCYIERKEINERLKSRIKDICPILIKGSIEEARL